MNQEKTKQELQKLLDRTVSKNAGIRSGLAAVSTGDETFNWSGIAGLANPAKNTPMTEATPFFMASITKMLTATVIMLLYEQKKLGLDDPMSKYLPNSLIEGIQVYHGTDYTKQIQIRHLLSHTSGIADYYLEKPSGGKSFFELLVTGEANERTIEDTIARAREKLSANFVPDERASYSDTNYQLLGFIIESVTEKQLHEVYQSLLFEPLDMRSTFLHTRSVPKIPQIKEVAHIFYKDIDLTYNDAFKTSWADGGLVSTMADCLSFLKALNRGEIFQNDDTLAMMHTWRKLKFPLRYGFGTMSMKLPRIFSPTNPIPEVIGHFGSTGIGLFFCADLDVYLVGATNQVKSQTKLNQLIFGIIKRMKKLLFTTILSIALISGHAQEYRLTSPDGFLTANISIHAHASVKLSKMNELLLKLDEINLLTADGQLEGMKVQKSSNQTVSNTVIPVIKEKSDSYPENYNELSLAFRSDKALTFRLYNEGLAYRFETSKKDSLTILKENLRIQFHESDSTRYQSSQTFNSSYETPYEHDRMGEMKLDKLCNMPLLTEKHNGSLIMITESDLYSYPGLWLENRGNALLKGVHPPYPKTYNYSGRIYGHGQILETYDFIAKVKGVRTYPWRIFAVADSEEDLIQNNLVYLLASPTELDNVSWIKPGVVMFDWWAKKYIYGVDFKSGINTETAKYFIDFCADQGFRYFLFDDGWCPKDDLLSVNPELDMEEVTSYASVKGVDIMLWVIWHALERQWDAAFDQFERWGIKGIKMDFMNRDDQKMVQFYESVARKAAEKKMVVNFHGAYKPSGLRRKYPNVLTREALIEFEYNGWSDYVTPEHDNLLPYIRMFTGPMDYIPATTRNSSKNSFRKSGDYPMGQGTRAHAMAMFVILNSPMTMLPDSPSDYYREQECTDFLANIPVEWDESRLLKGKIGRYTILGRRNGDEWFVGAITDWAARKFTLNTQFLTKGKYQVDIISDGINADTRAEDYKRSTIQIQKGDEIEINMLSGGGFVARFTPVK